MAVGHFEDCSVADVQLVLAPAKLALRRLDRDAGRSEMPAVCTVELLRPRPLQQVIVFQVPADLGQIPVSTPGRVQV